MIKKFIWNLFPVKLQARLFLILNRPYILVHSHPRSGTHFLEAFLGENFYKNTDLSVNDIQWGHWSNLALKDSNEYGKLFGSHGFADSSLLDFSPMIYIKRDCKAVAYSIWNSENFIHKDKKDIEFADFLRMELDWQEAPEKQTKNRMNIVQHWQYHVLGWYERSTNGLYPNLIIIDYETLKSNPMIVYKKILKKFFPVRYFLERIFGWSKIETIAKPLGISPNKGTVDAWKDHFTKSDLQFVVDTLKQNEL